MDWVVVRRWTRLPLLLIAASFFSQLGLADTCMPSSSVTGSSADGRFVVTVERRRERWHRQRPWEFRWTDLETGQTRRGNIDRIESHAHLRVFVAGDGARFAVTDFIAGNRYRDRILLYRSDGELIRSIGISDILLFHERDDVSHSVSHVSWLGYDKDRKTSTWVTEDGQGIRLMTRSETPATISWIDGSVTRESWKLNLLQNAPVIWWSTSGILMLAAFVFVRKPGDLRLMLTLGSFAAALLGVLVWWVWESEMFVHPQKWMVVRAALLSIGSIMLLWVVLGDSTWLKKLAMVVFCSSVLLIEFLLVEAKEMESLPRTAGTFAILTAAILGIARWRGCRLRRSPKRLSDDEIARPRWRQFRIRDLLLCAGFIAFFATAVRLHLSREMMTQRAFVETLHGALWSIFTIAVCWTILSSRGWGIARCGIVLTALTIGVTLAPAYPIQPGFDVYWWRSNLYLLLMVFVFLLTMRIQDYRLTITESARNRVGLAN